MNSLIRKRILVTGASSGIGREIAIQTSKAGADVFITGRNSERLEETKNSIQGNCESFVCDLTDSTSLNDFIKQLPELDGIVFCAGVVEYIPVKFINESKLNYVFSINFNSQVLLTQSLLKNKKINKKGSLVYISSISSKIGVMGTALYASSKAALNAFSKVLASELATQEIRSNTICPGIVKTPMIDMANSLLSEDSILKVADDYPLGLGLADDVAGTTIFLLSDSSRWITGTELILDGGLTIK